MLLVLRCLLSVIFPILPRAPSLRPSAVNARMARGDAGKTKKGKNFSAEEERLLCCSFLHVSQDPIAGNGQRSTAFWKRITKHFNQVKPCGSPLRPARSLETKWGHIKHDVDKFCSAYKQVYDCKESGTSLDDVLERALEYYKDRHPKQAAFAYLHCWGLLKEVTRWWDSSLDVQKRQGGIDNHVASTGKQKGRRRTEQPRGVAIEGGSNGAGEVECDADGTGEGSNVEVLTHKGFFRRLPPARREIRPQNRLHLCWRRESRHYKRRRRRRNRWPSPI